MDTKSTHPLILTAAAAVILASGVAIAAMTGLLPSGNAGNNELAMTEEQLAEQEAAEKDALAEDSKPAEPAPAKAAATSQKPAPRPAASRPAPVQTAAVCNSCGQVAEVRRVVIEGQGSGIGAVAGGVVGGLLGNQVGGGNGRKAMTVLGAAGGAYAGNEIEKNRNAQVRYDVVVAFNDGTTGVYPYANQPGWQPGDRVRVVNGQITSDL